MTIVHVAPVPSEPEKKTLTRHRQPPADRQDLPRDVIARRPGEIQYRPRDILGLGKPRENGAATFSFVAKAGQTYQIAVDGFAGASGSIKLRVTSWTVPSGSTSGIGEHNNEIYGNVVGYSRPRFFCPEY